MHSKSIYHNLDKIIPKLLSLKVILERLTTAYNNTKPLFNFKNEL